jgi:hypothetical protein
MLSGLVPRLCAPETQTIASRNLARRTVERMLSLSSAILEMKLMQGDQGWQSRGRAVV